MMHVINEVKRNWLFRKLSSVQLAVPLLLIIGAVVSYGTILESQYNSEYAKMIIYNAWWFQILLFMLGLNILCAALSRIPYKIHHTGFVVTHAGMIIILIGSVITQKWGIDGQLRIIEGSKGQSLILEDRAMELVSDDMYKKIMIPRSRSKMDADDLKKYNEAIAPFRMTQYLPFVDPNKAYAPATGGLTLDFTLESPFFKQSEWLNIRSKPEMQMGPATLRLIVDSKSPTPKPTPVESHAKKKSTPKNSLSGDFVMVLDDKSGKTLQSVSLPDFKKGPVKINGVSLTLKNAFQRATVSNNKLTEGDGGAPNPALEIMLVRDQQTEREVLFAKYPDFSMNRASLFGLRLVYKRSDVAETDDGDDSALADSNASPSPRPATGNVIEFHYNEATEKVRLELYKNGQSVLTQKLDKSQTIQTPWMNMKITLNDINQGRETSSSSNIQEVEVPKKVSQLPPSAIYLIPPGQSDENGFWLAEGQVHEHPLTNGTAQVYYGRNIMSLPFYLQLEKFYKKTYPGTDTAISFESHVRINGTGDPVVISMNEPLKKDGYTLYQSSFEMEPGQPTASIFSVNRDPGRPVKYLGSIVMAIGIIIFTYMRSRLYKNRRKPA